MIDLSAPYLEIVKHILTEHVPQYTVWVFGSRVGGVVKAHSDLDLAVLSDRPLDLNCLGNLRDAFENSDLPIRVDIVDWSTITNEFRDVIKSRYEVVQERTILPFSPIP